jgi:hypothetical protein
MKKIAETAETAGRWAKTAGQPGQVRRLFRFDNSFSR